MTDIQQREPHEEQPPRTGRNWEDPNVAVGNAPPMPVWPLAVAILAWLGGIVFLFTMMMERLG